MLSECQYEYLEFSSVGIVQETGQTPQDTLCAHRQRFEIYDQWKSSVKGVAPEVEDDMSADQQQCLFN